MENHVPWKNFIFVHEKSKESCYIFERSSTLCCTVLFGYKGAEQHINLNRKLLISRVASLKTILLFQKTLFTFKVCCYLKEHHTSEKKSLSRRSLFLKFESTLLKRTLLVKRKASYRKTITFKIEQETPYFKGFFLLWKVGIPKEGSLLLGKSCCPLKELHICPWKIKRELLYLWKKFYTVLCSAFWLQRCWATYKIEQETVFFKGGLFENNIVISKNTFYF